MRSHMRELNTIYESLNVRTSDDVDGDDREKRVENRVATRSTTTTTTTGYANKRLALVAEYPEDA